MRPADVHVRDASLDDAVACAAIYAPYVVDSVASFEEAPPDALEISKRMSHAWCWLVAELDNQVVGYAYGSRHRERPAYRWAADVTVYLHASIHRRGIGRALYQQLIPRLREMGFRTLCAGITEPNPASIGLHRSIGFEIVGTYQRIGWKADAWHDVTWMQLQLRNDPGTPREPVTVR